MKSVLFTPNILKQSSPDPKPEPTVKKKPVPLRFKPKKKTGEAEVFEYISQTRKHVSFVSGEFLGEDLQAWHMAHVLPKGKYPLFRLQSANIVLLTQHEHDQFDKQPRSKIKNDPKWKSLFELEAELKKQYSKLSKTKSK